MAWRAIQDTVGQSESLAELSHLAERLYWRLLAHSDPWGRLDAKPRKLRARCWPMLGISDQEVGWALVEVEQVGRIVVWERDGDYVLQVTNFEQNQPREAFRKRSGKSRYPDPPRGFKAERGAIASLFGLGSSTGQLPGISGRAPEIAAPIPEEVRPRREETETEKRREGPLRASERELQDAARSPAEEHAREDEPEPLPEPEEPNGTGPMAEAARAELRRLREARA